MRKIKRRDLLKQAAVLSVALPIVIATKSSRGFTSPPAADTGSSPTDQNRPVCPSGAPPESASFIDPTVMVSTPLNITLDQLVYIAPFAQLLASDTAGIQIGAESNAQDNVTILAAFQRDNNAQTGITALGLHDTDGVQIGEQCILAHGATIKGPAVLGQVATLIPRSFSVLAQR